MELIILIIICGAALYYLNKRNPSGVFSYDSLKWGQENKDMICSQCQDKGFIRTKSVQRKKGVSGGKATAAILTLGITMLATGLSRKEGLTQAHCTKCNSTWDF